MLSYLSYGKGGMFYRLIFVSHRLSTKSRPKMSHLATVHLPYNDYFTFSKLPMKP